MTLIEGWQLAGSEPDRYAAPPALETLDWQPLGQAVPVAAVRPELSNADLDGQDWWYRASFEPGDADAIVLESVATVADVFLDGELVAHSESMFRPVAVAFSPGRGRRELAICCRALGPRLAQRRRPRARWRTQLVDAGNLRFYRTMLLGRAPGFAPGPAAVGLCAPVRLIRADARPPVSVRTRLDGRDGVISVRGPDGLTGAELVLSGPTGPHRGRVGEDLRIPDVALWWPHTHGEPSLYEVTAAGAHVARVGFRSLSWPADWEQTGFRLAVNGVEVFCRGAVWTPLDLAAVTAPADQLAERLALVVAAGMNMLRIPGTATYESDTFHDLCDQLGILVWQDMMFANLDYPDTEPSFVAEVEAEAAYQLDRLAGRPSLAVLCGGSECAQQVTMQGLDPELARGPLYTHILPRALEASGADAAYIPNTPWGGDLPFRPDTGVANYYGVGAYLRDPSDARLSRVGFAGECLAFANVGEHAELTKQGIPRDVGAGWDFEDVRDHYLGQLYDLDPVSVRWSDPERYLALSRMVTGDVMADAFGVWRAAGSATAGALVLWLADLHAGSGWGILDARGAPKAAYRRLARALAPRAVWLTDEGLGGIDVHVANDGATPLDAILRVALYRDGEIEVATETREIAVPAHGYARLSVEAMIGRFVDVSWTYRFGPPHQDVVVASLGRDGELISQAFAYPVQRPLRPHSVAELGLSASLAPVSAGRMRLVLHTRRVVYGLSIRAEGWEPTEDTIDLEPGHERVVSLTQTVGDVAPQVRLSALNMTGSVRVALTRLEVGPADADE